VIILDTNVVSAIMQDSPDAAVAEWLDGEPRESLWTTSITIYELRFGIEILATGRKRQNLETALDRLLHRSMHEKILPFDQDAAEHAARISAERRASGRPSEIRDVEIAGIVRARKATLATRNVRHFQDVGLKLVNPWSV
jgi:predicted nucleic acid-binding protein